MIQFDLRICFKWVVLENSRCNINFHQLETPKTWYFQLPPRKWYKFLGVPGSIRFSLVNLWIIIIVVAIIIIIIIIIIINIDNNNNNNNNNNSSNICPKCRLVACARVFVMFQPRKSPGFEKIGWFATWMCFFLGSGRQDVETK